MQAVLILLFLLSPLVRAAEDPAAVLTRCKERVKDFAAHLPNYTCRETVDRRYYRPQKTAPPDQACAPVSPEKLTLQATDRIRLEVKISEGKEIGSWPGASQFDSRSIFDLIGGGTFSTGPLGTLLVDVFDNPGVSFSFQGEENKLLSYRYAVPLNSSHYYIQAWGNWKPVAFDGVVWIEPAAADLRRIEVRTHQLPSETQACYSTTVVDYERIGAGGDFLAPSHSRLQFFMQGGDMSETSNVYSGCRAFQVESTVRFDDGPQVPDKVEQSRAPLRAGLAIPLSFDSPIDSKTAAAGDVVQAITRKPVLDPQSGQVLVPAGAAAELRITRMRQVVQSPGYVFLTLTPERVQISGGWAPFFAKQDSKDQIENGRRMMSAPGAQISLPTGNTPGAAAYGMLFFSSSKSGHIVPRGFQTNWITTAPPAN